MVAVQIVKLVLNMIIWNAVMDLVFAIPLMQVHFIIVMMDKDGSLMILIICFINTIVII